MSTKPAFAIRCTRGWVAFYTRNLPGEVAERRRAEIESDLWEHINDEASNDRVADQILGRCLRGIPADVWWRYHTLLAQRGVRERSRDMFRNLRNNWWPPLVVLYAIVATAFVAVPVIFGDEQSSAAQVGLAVAVTAGGLMMAGLAVRRRRLVAGSWMVGVGAIPGLVSPLLPLGLAVLIGGVWTANLAFREVSPGIAPDHVLTARRAHIAGIWWRWMILAAVLTAIGFAMLLTGELGGEPGGNEDTSVVNGLVWAVWVLSWLAAAVTAAVGVVLAVTQLTVRHRTRHA